MLESNECMYVVKWIFHFLFDVLKFYGINEIINAAQKEVAQCTWHRVSHVYYYYYGICMYVCMYEGICMYAFMYRAVVFGKGFATLFDSIDSFHVMFYFIKAPIRTCIHTYIHTYEQWYSISMQAWLSWLRLSGPDSISKLLCCMLYVCAYVCMYVYIYM